MTESKIYEEIAEVTGETEDAIRRKSAHALPDAPSAAGMKPDQIRRRFWEALCGENDSLLSELGRVITEANGALSRIAEYEEITRRAAESAAEMAQAGVDGNAKTAMELKTTNENIEKMQENTTPYLLAAGKVYPNIEALKASEILQEGDVVTVERYHANVDCPPFRMKIVAEGVANGYDIVALSAKEGLLAQLIYTDKNDIRHFGAKCNTSYDDTPQIQRAVDACDTVYFPYTEKGIAHKCIQLKTNSHIISDAKTVLVHPSADVSKPRSREAVLYWCESISNVIIEGIRADCNASVLFRKNNDASVGGTMLDIGSTAFSSGVYITGCDGVTIRDCSFADFKDRGIGASQHSGMTVPAVKNLTVERCSINGYLSYVGTCPPLYEGGSTIENYKFVAPTRGIQILQSSPASQNIVIRDCTINECGEHGIVFYNDTDGVLIDNCTVKNVGRYEGKINGESGDAFDFWGQLLDGAPAASPALYRYSQGSCIKLNGASNVKIVNTYAYNPRYCCISVHKNPKNIQISDCTLEGNPSRDRTGGAIWEATETVNGAVVTPSFVTIKGCLIKNHRKPASAAYALYAIMARDRTTVSGCVIVNCSGGIACYGSCHEISGNEISGTIDAECILLMKTISTSITGNMLSHTTAGNNVAVRLKGASYVSIAGNTHMSSKYYYGLYAQDGVACKYVNIAGFAPWLKAAVVLSADSHVGVYVTEPVKY